MSEASSDKVTPDMASDLAYVRSLAEEGRDAPLVGGAYYVIWGGVMGAASLLSYLTLTGVISLGMPGMFGPWIAAGVIGWVASMTLARRSGRKPGSLTLGNRTAAATWFAVGVFMTAFWVALIFVHDDFTAFGVPPYFLFTMMFPIAFGVYGVAFYASAVAARARWLKIFAFLSWGFSIASLFVAGSAYQFLLGAAGCIACAALPGWLVMRGEPKEII